MHGIRTVGVRVVLRFEVWHHDLPSAERYHCASSLLKVEMMSSRQQSHCFGSLRR